MIDNSIYHFLDILLIHCLIHRNVVYSLRHCVLLTILSIINNDGKYKCGLGKENNKSKFCAKHLLKIVRKVTSFPRIYTFPPQVYVNIKDEVVKKKSKSLYTYNSTRFVSFSFLLGCLLNNCL